MRGRREGKLNFSDFVIGLNAMTRADQEERTKCACQIIQRHNDACVEIRREIRMCAVCTTDSTSEPPQTH